MKLLVAFFVAVSAFTTVVIGVPSAVEMIPLASRFPDFLANIQCIYNAIDKVMVESNIEDLWHSVKIQMNGIVQVEWQNCLKLVDNGEQEKCKKVVIGHGVHVVTKFANQLVYDHKLDLDWARLYNDIATKCFKVGAPLSS